MTLRLACDEQCVRSAQSAHRFPQQTRSGNDVAISERLGRIDQHQIEISPNHSMLKSVIEDERINRLVELECLLGSFNTIGICNDGNWLQCIGQKLLLVADP